MWDPMYSRVQGCPRQKIFGIFVMVPEFIDVKPLRALFFFLYNASGILPIVSDNT